MKKKKRNFVTREKQQGLERVEREGQKIKTKVYKIRVHKVERARRP